MLRFFSRSIQTLIRCCSGSVLHDIGAAAVRLGPISNIIEYCDIRRHEQYFSQYGILNSCERVTAPTVFHFVFFNYNSVISLLADPG